MKALNGKRTRTLRELERIHEIRLSISQSRRRKVLQESSRLSIAIIRCPWSDRRRNWRARRQVRRPPSCAVPGRLREVKTSVIGLVLQACGKLVDIGRSDIY
jgi:hypothetical protein